MTCYDWDSDGSHDLIGIFTTSLGQLMEAQDNKTKVHDHSIYNYVGKLLARQRQVGL